MRLMLLDRCFECLSSLIRLIKISCQYHDFRHYVLVLNKGTHKSLPFCFVCVRREEKEERTKKEKVVQFQPPR